MAFTCIICLNGSHRRCSEPHDCACSICAARTGRKVDREEITEVPSDLPAKRLIREPDVPSDSPQASYMRRYRDSKKAPEQLEADRARLDEIRETNREYMKEYRRKKKEGISTAPSPSRLTPEILREAQLQHDSGRSYRAIAEDLGVNHSYLAKAIKACH